MRAVTYAVTDVLQIIDNPHPIVEILRSKAAQVHEIQPMKKETMRAVTCLTTIRVVCLPNRC